MKKSILKIAKVVSVTALLLSSGNIYSQSITVADIIAFITGQGGDPDDFVINEIEGGGFEVLPADSPSIPLDGELGLLLLGATAFGVNKLRKKNAKA